MCRFVPAEGWSERQPSSLSPPTNRGVRERVLVQPISWEATTDGHSQGSSTVRPAGKDLVSEQAYERETVEEHDFGDKQWSSIQFFPTQLFTEQQ